MAYRTRGGLKPSEAPLWTSVIPPSGRQRWGLGPIVYRHNQGLLLLARQANNEVKTFEDNTFNPSSPCVFVKLPDPLILEIQQLEKTAISLFGKIVKNSCIKEERSAAHYLKQTLVHALWDIARNCRNLNRKTSLDDPLYLESIKNKYLLKVLDNQKNGLSFSEGARMTSTGLPPLVGDCSGQGSVGGIPEPQEPLLDHLVDSIVKILDGLNIGLGTLVMLDDENYDKVSLSMVEWREGWITLQNLLGAALKLLKPYFYEDRPLFDPERRAVWQRVDPSVIVGGYNRPHIVDYDRFFGHYLLLARKTLDQIQPPDRSDYVTYRTSDCTIYSISASLYDDLVLVDRFLATTFDPGHQPLQEDLSAAVYLRHVMDHALYKLAVAPTPGFEGSTREPIPLETLQDFDLCVAIKNTRMHMSYHTGANDIQELVDILQGMERMLADVEPHLSHKLVSRSFYTMWNREQLLATEKALRGCENGLKNDMKKVKVLTDTFLGRWDGDTIQV